MAIKRRFETGDVNELVQEATPKWILPKAYETQTEEAKAHESRNAAGATKESHRYDNWNGPSGKQ